MSGGSVERIDLNADVGEGYDDRHIFSVVSSVNIACGAHAGDEQTMRDSVEAALASGAAIGAHPGYADRATMGRADVDMALDDVRRIVLAQIEALAKVADDLDATMAHVKPHGALYNRAAIDVTLAETIARAVADVHPELAIVGLAGGALVAAARAIGLVALDEAFADRRYLADGTLAPRARADALITDPAEAARQALAIARGEPITTVDGTERVIAAQTICCHADTPGSLGIAGAVRAALADAGIAVAPPV